MATHRLGLATLGSVDFKLDGLAGLVTADDLGVQLEVDALLLQDLLGLLGNLIVHAGSTDLAEELDNGNLRTEAGPDGSHLKTNDTTTDDDHLLGDLLQGNSAGAADDPLLVDLQTGEGASLATGGDQDVLANNACLAAIVKLHLDLLLVDEGAAALDVLYAVLLEEELDTLGQTSHGRVLGLHEVRQVQLDITDLDTPVLGVVEDLVVEM